MLIQAEHKPPVPWATSSRLVLVVLETELGDLWVLVAWLHSTTEVRPQTFLS